MKYTVFTNEYPFTKKLGVVHIPMEEDEEQTNINAFNEAVLQYGRDIVIQPTKD